jgi:choline dehydrogenase-like flavoprotein
VTEFPFFSDDGADLATLAASLDALLAILRGISNASVALSAEGVSPVDYITANFPPSVALGANHWVGSTRTGEVCEGEGLDGKVVVDAETRVCGVEGLHVVDTSVVGGVPSGNPQAVFVVVGWRAGERILKLG